MAISDRTAALQAYYLSKYNTELWVIMRLGGCIFQQQLCRWLNNNKTDTTSNTALVKRLEEAQLIKIKKVGNKNNILILTYPVFKYFRVNRTAKINGAKIKRSAMIMEKYLRMGYYTKDPIELKKRLEKTSCLPYMTTGEPALRLLQKYIPLLENRGWCVDGLKHQEQIMYQRFDHQTKFLLYENYPPLKLDKEDGQLDLYNLECQNAFISGIRFDKLQNGKEQLQAYIDIYNVYEKDPSSIAKLVLDAQRTIESIFADYKNDNFVDVYIQVYSHNEHNVDYENKLYTYLCTQNEYIGNEELVRNRIRLVFLDSRTSLFSNIDPSSIV